MSIEDPRISAISSENVSHDFRQDIHEDASIEASAQQGVEVAQADISQQPEKTDRVPAPPQTVAADAHPAEVVPDQNNIAHLPADVSIDDIRVEGNNLVLVQADGTEIVIVNGALHVPTFLLGEVELPQQAVIAALEQSHINVAAGPDGSYSASSGSPSSGGNFDMIQQPPHLPPLIADLLPPTDQPDGQPGRLFGGIVNGSGNLLAANPLSVDTPAPDHGVTVTIPAAGGATTTVWEAGLPGGSAEGLSADPTVVIGTFTISAPDGVALLTIGATTIIGADLLNAATFPISVTPDGSPLGTLVITAYNAATHEVTYQFTLANSTTHGDTAHTGAADQVSAAYGITVTDTDGDSASGKLTIAINDDGPEIKVIANENAASVLADHQTIVDETGFGRDHYNSFTEFLTDPDWNLEGNVGLGRVTTHISGGLTSLFSIGADSTYGADGAGTTTHALSFTVEGNMTTLAGGAGVATNLSATGHDGAITLYFGDDAHTSLVGIDADGKVAFRIAIVNNQFQTTLYEAIKQPDNSHFDESIKLLLSGDSGVTIKLTDTVTRTDADGDTVSQSASIDLISHATGQDNGGTSYFSFQDDGPSINLHGLQSVRVDEDDIETALSHGTSPNDGIADGSFTAPSGAAEVKGSLANMVNFGSDGIGGFSFVGQGTIQATLGALHLSSHGDALTYQVANGVLTAHAGGEEADRIAFSLTLTNDGHYTFDLFDQIDHDVVQGQNTGLQGTLHNGIDFGSLIQATDGDGDSITLNGGLKVTIRDDVPVVAVSASDSTAPTLETQDADATSGNHVATASFTGAFSVISSYGADGAAAANAVVKTYSLDVTGHGLVDSGLASHGHQIYLYEVHGQIVGSTASNSHNISAANTIFAMSVNSATGEVTLTQYGAIDHGGNGSSISLASNLVSLTETVTITDYDGDKATDSAKIDLSGHITFTDATPTANATVAASLDDEGQPNGIDAGAGDLAGANSKSYSGTLAFSAGADGSKSIEITGLTVQNSAHQGNGDLQVLYVDGNGVAHAETVTFTWNSVTNEYVGTSDHFGGADGGAAAVIVTVSQTGEYNIAINAPLAHPFTTEQNTAVAGSEYEDDLTLNFTYQVTDGDGDKASNTLSVTVDDDSPTMGGASAIAVIGTGAQVSVTGTLDFHAGADGAGHANLAGNVAPENLVSGGETVHYWVSADGATLIAYTGANVDTGTNVFQLQIADNQKGYTFTEYATFGLQTTTTNTTTETFTKADGELDHANSPAASVNITTDNGATIVAVVSGSQKVNGSNGGFGLHSNNFDASDYLKFNFHQTVDSQPDPTTVTFSFAKNATVNYVVHYSDGTTVPVDNATVTAANGLTIPAHGNATILDVEFYNIDDKTKIDLGSATVTTETKTTTVSTNTDLSFTAGLTDGDGDAVSATINVHAVTNIPPTITVTPTGGVAGGHNLVDEAALSAGSHHVGSGSITTSGTLTAADANGNDDVQSVTIGGHTFAVATLVGTTAATGQTINGDHGTLTVYGYDASTGTLSYSYTLTSAVNGPGNSTNTVTGGDSFAVSVADTSGTTSTANVVVDIKDDVPTAHDVTVQSVAEGSVVTGTLDFVQGADGASVSKIGNVTLTFGNDGWSQSIAMEHGTLKVTADGHYQFTAQGADVYKDGGSSSFQVTVADGDGDTSTAKVSFNVTDGSTDVTTVSLTASTTTEGSNASYVFTATLTNASQGVTTVHTDQGDITIADGQTTGTLTIAANNG
ncbi:beta strand repeat-containing protein, partial [Rhizobium mesoamericanum]|uniref:beta strand repeat-containing protein n=1 Tax=Rhizobium mesoamericanum TaxID=1079800 RepID=UPI000491724C